jgi:3-dehydroquinate synthase
MQTININLAERSYPIYISDDFSTITEKIKTFTNGKKCCIISNPKVWPLYGKEIESAVQNSGAKVWHALIPDGEKYKNLTELEKLLNELVGQKLDRSSLLIALGGGIVGDVTGFAAASFMRGIPFIQIPTTILAQLDSSVGGKTGVNLAAGKNLVGAFYQPKMVFINYNSLATLPIRECRAGYAEVIKTGVIYDAKLFETLETETKSIFNALAEGNPEKAAALPEIIQRCCEIKAEVVAQDEHEKGLRAILNYGHTFAHAVEMLTNYEQFVHGEAVAIGMHAAAVFANKLGMCDLELINRQKMLIETAGLPTKFPQLDTEEVMEAFYHDKKTTVSGLKFVLPTKIGEVEVVKNPDLSALKEAIDECK